MVQNYESNAKNAESAEKAMREKLPEDYVKTRTAYAEYLLRLNNSLKAIAYEDWKKK